MLAKQFDEIFAKVTKDFEFTPITSSKNYVKSKAAFVNDGDGIAYMVVVPKMAAILHNPEDNAQAGLVRIGINETLDLAAHYNRYVKTEGIKELPEGYGLQAQGAMLVGRAAKEYGFEGKKHVEVDYLKEGDGYAIRIKDTLQNMTFICMLRDETAWLPEWTKYTNEEKAKMEADEERRKQKEAEYAEINRTLEA